MQLEGGIDQSFMQHVPVAPPVAVVEARKAMFAALDHMLPYPGRKWNVLIADSQVRNFWPAPPK